MNRLPLIVLFILLCVAMGFAFDRALDIEFPAPVANKTTAAVAWPTGTGLV